MKKKIKGTNGKNVEKQTAIEVKRIALPLFFKSIGINSPYTLFSARLKGQLDTYARQGDLNPEDLRRLVDKIAKALPEIEKNALEEEAARPIVTGHIDWTDPRQKKFYEQIGIKERKPLSKKKFAEIPFKQLLTYLIPRGPVKAVDLRPFLGDARNQQGRGTCAVFAATAVAEAMEYFRDRRSGPVDLSEEFVWWYRGAGQRYSAGGYDCGAALDDIRDLGISEEYILPYNGTQINDNHTHVPITDTPIDRAQFYRIGDAVSLPTGDVAAVKRVIESGRCVAYASNLDGWNTGTGEIAMPPDGTARGGAHCTTIVGYIDKDDLPPSHEGGYFIIRNSWGGAGSTTNILGPEYGGHLLMPYGWYRLYAGWPHTTMDKNDEEHRNKWLVEYYDNPELRGAPLESRSVSVHVFPIDIKINVPIPQQVDEVDFDWRGGSPVRYELPIVGSVDVLPKNSFSIRFSKLMRFREGWYCFRLRADDGVRLYVDDRLVVNEWKDQPDTLFSAEHYLTGGDHVIRIEYYEAGGNADVHFDVVPINWHYELFSNHTFTGIPAAIFDDTLTQLEWRHAPPVAAGEGLANGQFALRGTATLHFKSGKYRFHNFSTGQLRAYLDDNLVVDLMNDGDMQEVTVAAGDHQVKIEFINPTTVPASDSQTYYKALCSFGWSELAWNAKFYKNDRCEYYANNWAELNTNPDHDYIFFRTNALAGHVRYEHDYPEADVINNNLSFNSWGEFKTGLTDWPASFEQNFWSVWINRKIVVGEEGSYNLTLNANEGFRLVVDGKEIVQNQVTIGNCPYNAEVFLTKGIHDVSIEYSATQWGGNLIFNIQPAKWRVDYFANTTLQGAIHSTQYIPLDKVIERAQATVSQTYYSARISRTRFFPLGKYVFTVKVDDGVRLKVNNRLLVDAWYDQGPTTYAAAFEHQGGDMKVEIEYYQGGGGALLELSVHPTDFYAEYYNTTTLNKMPAGVDRPRVTPIAYRYDGDINFDWGTGSNLPRIGASNFSVRWRSKVYLPVGRWRIEATSDDGIRVYIGGRLIIDHWHDGALATHARMIDLVGREHDVMVEYYQKTGNGVCKLKYFREV